MPFLSGGRGFVNPSSWHYPYENYYHPTPPPQLQGAAHGYFLGNSPPLSHSGTYSLAGSSPNISRNDSLRSPTPPHLETYNDSSMDATTFSNKVFIGRIPHNVTRRSQYGRALECIFARFGDVDVQWPKPATHPSRNRASRLTGYLFLIYKSTDAVKELQKMCVRTQTGDLFLALGPALDNIMVHVRLWSHDDAVYCIDESLYLNASINTVFLGRVPRVCTAYEIATFMQAMFGNVLCVQVDVDPTNHYPQGSAAVYFDKQVSYLSALKTRHLDMQRITGRNWITEVKPFIRFGGSCDECEKRRATRFCGELRCLQYYCNGCWNKMHDSKNHPHMSGHVPFEEVLKSKGRNCHPKNVIKEDTTRSEANDDFKPVVKQKKELKETTTQTDE